MKAADFLGIESAEEFLGDDEPDDPPKKRRLLEELLNEVTAALEQATATLSQDKESSASVAQSMARLVKAIEARKSDRPVSALTDAIKSLREVTVNVSPTPITVTAPAVQIIERAKPGAFEMRFTYDREDRLQTAVLVPLESIPKPKKPVTMYGGRE